MRARTKAILAGLATYIPGYDYSRATGGTGSARYCYSVWMRHLVLSATARSVMDVPKAIAELGPGDSIGIGLCGLLSGAERYYALDIVAYSDLKSNLAIFDELVQLFLQREPVPGEEEFPSLKPRLPDYAFPEHLLDEALLRQALRPSRVSEIRASIEHSNEPGSHIVYRAPWNDPAVIQPQTVDMIYSQAVLEHIDNLPDVYAAMRSWLKPNGVMSHQIDYRCHGKADAWNGHWTYSDAAWKVIVGRRSYLLNRTPHSEHVRLLAEAGFQVVEESLVRSPSELERAALAPRFKQLSSEDLTTSGAFVVCVVASEKKASTSTSN